MSANGLPPLPSHRSHLLETSFVLRLLAAALLVLQGGLRLRGDAEQGQIWLTWFQYPARLMRAYGSSQVAAALLTVFIPWFGLAAAAAAATTEMLNHILRMGSAGAAVFDFAVLGIAVFLSLVYGTSPLPWVLFGIASGVAGFWWLNSRFPHRGRRNE